MSIKILLPIFVAIIPVTISAQNDLQAYLKNNTYSLSLEQPASEQLTALFQKMAGSSKLILLGESGSHFLKFYSVLEANMLIHLNRSVGLKTFIIEAGSSTAYLCNKYLATGNSDILPKFSQERSYIFWKLIYQYNQSIPPTQQLKVIGIDFESPISYFKALNDLLPRSPAPESITKEINLIRASTMPVTCNELSKIDNLLKISLKKNRAAWQQFTGAAFDEVYTIISNKGACKDALANRNKNLKNRFLIFDTKLQEPIYYGQLGQAHTTLDNKQHFAALLNNDRNTRFYNQVSVVNTYCHNCKTDVEPVSNWVLQKIEKDIQQELVQPSHPALTLFDFSGAPLLTGKYLRYGQYLLIAKDQE